MDRAGIKVPEPQGTVHSSGMAPVFGLHILLLAWLCRLPAQVVLGLWPTGSWPGLTSSAPAHPSTLLLRRLGERVQRLRGSAGPDPGPRAGWLQQPLDPFNSSDDRTFLQVRPLTPSPSLHLVSACLESPSPPLLGPPSLSSMSCVPPWSLALPGLLALPRLPFQSPEPATRLHTKAVRMQALKEVRSLPWIKELTTFCAHCGHPSLPTAPGPKIPQLSTTSLNLELQNEDTDPEDLPLGESLKGEEHTHTYTSHPTGRAWAQGTGSDLY